MKLTSIIAVIVPLLTFSSIACAQEAPNSVRIDLSYARQSTVLDTPSDRITTMTGALSGTVTYQSRMGLFGQIGYSEGEITDQDIDGVDTGSDLENTSTMIGIGYRFYRFGSNGGYFGVGYQNVSTDLKDVSGDVDDVDIVRLFLEKDNARRYGLLDLSYSSNDTADLFTLSGRHLWFVSGLVGIGFSWSVGSGKQDVGTSSADSGVAGLGLVLMIRPQF